AGIERSQVRGGLEISISRCADIFIRRGRQLFEIDALRSVPEHRLLLENLDRGMAHEEGVEQRCSGPWEADQEDRRAPLVELCGSPTRHPFRSHELELPADGRPIG